MEKNFPFTENENQDLLKNIFYNKDNVELLLKQIFEKMEKNKVEDNYNNLIDSCNSKYEAFKEK